MNKTIQSLIVAAAACLLTACGGGGGGSSDGASAGTGTTPSTNTPVVQPAPDPYPNPAPTPVQPAKPNFDAAALTNAINYVTSNPDEKYYPGASNSPVVEQIFQQVRNYDYTYADHSKNVDEFYKVIYSTWGAWYCIDEQNKLGCYNEILQESGGYAQGYSFYPGAYIFTNYTMPSGAVYNGIVGLNDEFGAGGYVEFNVKKGGAMLSCEKEKELRKFLGIELENMPVCW